MAKTRTSCPGGPVSPTPGFPTGPTSPLGPGGPGGPCMCFTCDDGQIPSRSSSGSRPGSPFSPLIPFQTIEPGWPRSPFGPISPYRWHRILMTPSTSSHTLPEIQQSLDRPEIERIRSTLTIELTRTLSPFGPAGHAHWASCVSCEDRR